jgi:hypothetical protein
MAGFDDRPMWKIASRKGFRREVRRLLAVLDAAGDSSSRRLSSPAQDSWDPCGQRFGIVEKRAAAPIRADANGERGATAQGRTE